MAEDKELKIEEKNKQGQSKEKSKEKATKHICGAEHPRRCLCWKCMADMCEICFRIF